METARWAALFLPIFSCRRVARASEAALEEAYCPSLKGCHTWGHTYNEALANIQEVIELYVADLIESGESMLGAEI